MVLRFYKGTWEARTCWVVLAVRLLLLVLVQLLGEVSLDADLFDGVQLGFEVVDVFFLLDQDLLQQLARDRKSTRLNSSHMVQSRMPSSA